MRPEHEPLAPGGVVAGLSIDDRLLRVVVLDRSSTPTVLDDAEADLADGLVRHGRVVDHGRLGLRIADLWKVLGLANVPTFLGFQPVDARVRTVRLVRWTDDVWPDEVQAAVAAARSTYGEEPICNVTPLWRDKAVAARLAGCRHHDASALVAAARRGGVWVAGIELTTFAVERALQPVTSRFALLVDRTGAGSAALLLLDHGLGVVGWRAQIPIRNTDPALSLFALDEATAVAMVQGTIAPRTWLSAAEDRWARPAPLRRAGQGLAVASPNPPVTFAGALGLALGAAGIAPAPVDLHGPLLDAGLVLLHTQLGSLPLSAPPAGPTAAADPQLLVTGHPNGYGAPLDTASAAPGGPGWTATVPLGMERAVIDTSAQRVPPPAPPDAAPPPAPAPPVEPTTPALPAEPATPSAPDDGATAGSPLLPPPPPPPPPPPAPATPRATPGTRAVRPVPPPPAPPSPPASSGAADPGSTRPRSNGLRFGRPIGRRRSRRPKAMASLVDASTTLPDASGTLPDPPTTLPEGGAHAADLTPGALLVARVPVDEAAEGCGPDEPSDTPAGSTPRVIELDPDARPAADPAPGNPAEPIPEVPVGGDRPRGPIDHVAELRGTSLHFVGTVRSVEWALMLQERAVELFGSAHVHGGLLVDRDAVLDNPDGIRLAQVIGFPAGGTTLDVAGLAAVDELCALLVAFPATAIVLEGHTDRSGGIAENLTLSTRRADAVMAALVERGVARSRITAVGRGPFMPADDEATEAGQAANRRVTATLRGLLF